MQLQCPICYTPLQRDLNSNKTWQCQNRHSYDQAKQGYVNLHLVQHKHSKSPGDTPEAVLARREFLKQHHYQPLQQAIVQCIDTLNIDTALDIGCGEGYYTQAMGEIIPQLVAIDIAKSAVQIAAKQDQQQHQQCKITWVVTTGSRLPLANKSLDLCTSFFSPIPKDEILRTLKTQGYLLIATPAPKHLYQLRQALFEQVKLHEPEKFLQQLQPEFKLIQQQHIETHLMLNQQQLKNLIAMTPYAWKAKAERRAKVEQLSEFQVNAEFCLYLLQKV